MEFHIRLAGTRPDLAAIDEAVRAVDPAAVVDIDPTGAVLRVMAAMSADELACRVTGAGHPVAGDEVAQLPSVCCGGCSG